MINRAILGILLSTAMVCAFDGTAAHAQNCTAADFGAVVDQTAQALRDLNGSGSKRFQAKVAALRDKHGLSSADLDARTTGLHDDKIEEFNREIETHVAQMDVLAQTPNSKITCEKLEELKRVRDRLLTVMGQKSGYMLAKVEAELENPGKPAQQAAAPATGTTPPLASVEPARPAQPAPKETRTANASENRPFISGSPPSTPEARPSLSGTPPYAPEARPDTPETKPRAAETRPPAEQPQSITPRAAPPKTAADAPPPDFPARAPGPTPQRLARNTAPAERDVLPPPPMYDSERPTALAPPPGGSLAMPPSGGAPLPLPVEQEGYSISEIREAGRGVFGTITAEFAGAINYAFQNFGQPNAYISGTEGGAAFLAGLRYGNGTLYRKSVSPAPIYWQSPSAGLDFGAEGSRSLFLVYNLDDPYAIYGRFGGIGGSAYVAGGVGLNVLGKGGIVMVPIRSGVGLRLGANLAYVKFTERQTWNPF
jgi:hypothetical protein